jgi:hypothetical protein
MSDAPLPSKQQAYAHGSWCQEHLAEIERLRTLLKEARDGWMPTGMRAKIDAALAAQPDETTTAPPTEWPHVGMGWCSEHSWWKRDDGRSGCPECHK